MIKHSGGLPENQIRSSEIRSSQNTKSYEHWVTDSARDDASPYSADDHAKYFNDKIDSVRSSTAVTRCQQLAVPRYRLNTYGRLAFSVAGPTVWNSLPDFIRDPKISAVFQTFA